MSTEAKVDGYSKTRTVEGIPKNVSVTTVRFSSPGSLDTEFTGDGVKSVLVFLKEIAQQITNLSPDDPLPPEWSEIVKVPQIGTKVTVSFGIRTEFSEDI